MPRATAAASATSLRLLVENNDDDVTTSPSTLASHTTLASDLKYYCGSGIRVVGAQTSSCFGRFPLVVNDDSATAKDDDSNHIFLCFNSMLPTAEHRQCITELEVQDALLTILLKGFLRMQSVLGVEFDLQFFEGPYERMRRMRIGELLYKGSRGGVRRMRSNQENKKRRMDEVERKMRKMQLRQQQPASVTAPSANDAQIPARPHPILPSLLPRTHVCLQIGTRAPRCAAHIVHDCARGPAGFGRVIAMEKRIREGLERAENAATEDSEGCAQELEEYDASSVADWYAGIDYWGFRVWIRVRVYVHTLRTPAYPSLLLVSSFFLFIVFLPASDIRPLPLRFYFVLKPSFLVFKF
ncbi:LOW QUALITY PROTEIN: hypothetical protein CVT25_008853 [Psilocybe cyanescens]|uniref:Uncharacterized protein n=1 Tax=Psilocybe cyanescens TaxID=93625 RepID=A0A409XAK3_PSICY|nr:LOW QUALITY PROTEIN: hypothetical protein CVT25_008853 [Psilocybe cyanescens]